MKKQLIPFIIKPKINKEQKARLNELINAFCEIDYDSAFSDMQYKYDPKQAEQEKRDIDYLDYHKHLQLSADDYPILCTIINSDKIYYSGDKFGAYLHASCALTDSKNLDVFPNLVNQLYRLDGLHEDWMIEIYPNLLSHFDVPVIDILIQTQEKVRYHTVKSSINTALQYIAEKEGKDSQAWQKISAFLSDELKNHATNSHYYNATIVSNMIDLGLVKHIETIREAYQAKNVELMYCGDIEDVEIKFGLRTERATEKKNHFKDFLRATAEKEGIENFDELMDNFIHQQQMKGLKTKPISQAVHDIKD